MVSGPDASFRFRRAGSVSDRAFLAKWHLTYRTSKFVPRLGTAIARPAGYDYWSETHSAKDLDIERGFQGMATVPSVTHGTGGSGLAVSVHVDRRIA